ncbi:MAG: hypothetical protein FJY86_00850 [Candidatus Diapherotrites archaeon]|uniref:Uncharacterized protein n=1 Tax=Candidatus Iainarchaeum sp. TaxID=3101447 RepID=A0A8T4C6S2_9ARCH|nr:hypothetical protein [Candidatus Diapherotrites archaeon]
MTVAKESTKSSSAPNPVLKFVVGGVIVVLAAYLFLNASTLFPATTPPSTDTALSPAEATLPETFDDHSANLQVLKSTLSKEKFLKKLFEVDRSTYHLYDKAAQFLGVSNEEVTQFFYNCCDLTKESDIFSELPPISDHFSATAYDVSIGKLNQIGLLDEGFYKQPEFYTFIDQETGVVNREFSFRPWTRPELNQWGDNGMQAYPADQFDSVEITGRDTFTAVVFVTAGWNIQNYVGVNLVPNHDVTNYFDIAISEEKTGKSYFLLGPTFPRFSREWATKVVIDGKVKPGTPAGRYVIGINPVAPPSQLNQKWSEEYPGLYAPHGFIRPTDNYISLVIDVTA